jgi:hypothetical protein
MRFIVMVKKTPETEVSVPDKEAFEEMGRFNMELANAGMILSMDGLHPSWEGTKITFTGGQKSVTDGPFTEAKELVGGFWIIQAKSKEDAIAWMSRAPFENGQLEIRQLFEVSDFPSDYIDKEKNTELHSLIDRANVAAKSS